MQYNVIPGFTKYESTEKGLVRNIKTKSLISLEPSGDKYRLYNDMNERQYLTKKQIKDLMKQEPVKEVSAEVEQQPKIEKVAKAETTVQKTEKPAKAEKAVKEKTVKEGLNTKFKVGQEVGYTEKGEEKKANIFYIRKYKDKISIQLKAKGSDKIIYRFEETVKAL